MPLQIGEETELISQLDTCNELFGAYGLNQRSAREGIYRGSLTDDTVRTTTHCYKPTDRRRLRITANQQSEQRAARLRERPGASRTTKPCHPLGTDETHGVSFTE